MLKDFASTCAVCASSSQASDVTMSTLSSSARTVVRQLGIRQASTSSCRVLVVGSGTAGLAVSSKLSRSLGAGAVSLLDSREDHYYQPYWTLVGAGIKKLSDSHRKTVDLIPKGVQWIRESAVSFEPDKNCVTTSTGQQITYEYLVLALGISLNFDRIEGLIPALKDESIPVCSNYSNQTVEKTWKMIQKFGGGKAVFTFPNSPVKCAGAPQKIMYLFDDYLQRANKRSTAEISYFTALPVIFGAPKYAERLMQVVKRKEIQPYFRQDLIRVDAGDRKAIFKDLDNNDSETREVAFDFLHVTPHQSAPKVLKPFADASGFVDVDKQTLQCNRFSNVFALGDCSSAPTSKTAAAVSAQAPVLTHNLISCMNGNRLNRQYDGYTSCPLLTGYKSVILAEFDYNLKPKETFFFDQGKERLSMLLLKRDIIPLVYWNMLITGRWDGPSQYRRFLNPFGSG